MKFCYTYKKTVGNFHVGHFVQRIDSSILTTLHENLSFYKTFVSITTLNFLPHPLKLVKQQTFETNYLFVKVIQTFRSHVALPAFGPTASTNENTDITKILKRMIKVECGSRVRSYTQEEKILPQHFIFITRFKVRFNFIHIGTPYLFLVNVTSTTSVFRVSGLTQLI